MSSATKARRPDRQRRTRPRGSTAKAVLLLWLVATGGVAAWALSNNAQQPMAPASVNDIAGALASWPAADVAGLDPPNLPRPPGSTRAFYHEAGSVTTVLYDTHGATTEVWSRTVAALHGAGWVHVAPVEGRPAEGEPALYSRGQDLLQVSWFNGDSLVGVSYVVRLKD